MTDHLTPVLLNALADGELSADQLARVKEHLDGCSSCTSKALTQALLKTATAKSGQKYAMPPHVQERMKQLLSKQSLEASKSRPPRDRISSSWQAKQIAFLGWAVAAILLVSAISWSFVQRHTRRSDVALAEQASLATEVYDLHIATLASNLPPQVISSDRHTVKPWFQGKIPFSFNLPENLPADTKLDGANLTYLHDQPVAQLLYSVGKHHVSVFVREKHDADKPITLPTERSGFHVNSFSTGDLDVIAISDVDPTRLSGLVGIFERSQTNVLK